MIPFYQVDAFTQSQFSGNPAAIMILKEWLPNQVLQQIAEENNLSETAFVLQHDNDIELRWFTPACEVKLCGHATLAAAHVLFSESYISNDVIHFHTRESGSLHVHKTRDNKYKMDFPLDQISEYPDNKSKMEQALGCDIDYILNGNEDILVIVDSQKKISSIEPDFFKLSEFPVRGIIVSSIDENQHIYSRWFGPRCGVNEDPVTGSAHTTLAAYWGKELSKTTLSATQLSKRSGQLELEIKTDRVEIIGAAKTVIKGEFLLS